MRAFLAACIAAIILAVRGVLILGAVQRSSGDAFSTEGTRINSSWSWRQTFRRPAESPSATRPQSSSEVSVMGHAGSENCEEVSAYQWMFIDLGESHRNEACAVSQ